MVWRVISNFMPTFIPRLVLIRIFFEKNKWGFFRKLWGSLKKVGIFSKNVGIFEKKNGGDMWGFLIDEVGIFDSDHLETLGVIEIEAITNGILKIRSKKRHLIGIRINTDLLNATHNCRFWLPIFKKEGWKFYGKPVPIAYKKALEDFDRAKAGTRIIWCFKR